MTAARLEYVEEQIRGLQETANRLVGKLLGGLMELDDEQVARLMQFPGVEEVVRRHSNRYTPGDNHAVGGQRAVTTTEGV